MIPAFAGGAMFFHVSGPFLGICVMTYFIAKEIGNLKTSFLIALVLEGLTFLAFLATVAILVTGVIAAENG